MIVSVCVFVCLSAIISPEVHVQSSPNFCACLHVTYGHGSVLYWRCSDMLCTSGFVDDIVFAHEPMVLYVAAS